MGTYRHGKHTWRENRTADPNGNKDWYGKLLGWQITGQDMGDFVYNMFSVNGNALGGFAQLTEDQKKMGAPPHWLTYVSVADVDATSAVVTEAGGQIYAAPFDVPGVGRICVVADDQGAVFALYKGLTEDPEANAPPPPHGDVWWAELMTKDVAAAKTFYSKVLGWGVQSMEMPTGEYVVFLQGEDASCGCVALPEAVQAPPHWGVYFAVDDVDATLAAAVESGGTAHTEMMEAPGVGRFAMVGDPQGAAFGIITPDLTPKG